MHLLDERTIARSGIAKTLIFVCVWVCATNCDQTHKSFLTKFYTQVFGRKPSSILSMGKVTSTGSNWWLFLIWKNRYDFNSLFLDSCFRLLTLFAHIFMRRTTTITFNSMSCSYKWRVHFHCNLDQSKEIIVTYLEARLASFRNQHHGFNRVKYFENK